MAEQDRRRSSIFKRLSLLGRRSSNNGPAVWEVRNDDDLGLDVTPIKEKRRPRTLEAPSSAQSTPDHHSSPGERFSQTIERLGANHATPRSNGSTYSVRSQGSQYSISSASERPRPRTLESGIPPISPLTASAPSVTSSERASQRRSSHIQLVPRSMVTANASPGQSEDLRRIERELQAIGAQERKARAESLNTSGEEDRSQRPTSRTYSNSDRRSSSRSDASPSQVGKIRIQYVPRKSLSLEDDNDAALPVVEATSLSPSLALTPPTSFIAPTKPRINRSLTAVTEETRNNSEYHSDIDEEDGETDDEGSEGNEERKEEES